MKKLLSLSFLLLVALALPAQSYYTSIDGKQGGATLKTALYNLLKNHTRISYGSSTWSCFASTDLVQGTSNQVADMYSSTVRYYGSDGSAVSGMNIEHSFPKSWWGGTKNDAYCDLHHLNPSDASANSAKSNYPLGVVGTVKFDNGVTKVGTPSGESGGASYVFEPADEYKGDFARAYFYMVTCYQDFTFTNTSMVYENSAYPTLKPWAVQLLLQWARQDPVSKKEVARNEAVYGFQKNRNPYIDYPRIMEYVWGDSVNYVFHLNGDMEKGDTTTTDEYTKATIATALAGASGTKYEVNGTVVATYARGFMLGDATGSILVYLGSTPAVTYAIGDLINLKGATALYNGLNQFTATATLTKTGTTTYTYPSPNVMDGAALDAYAASPTAQYATFTGTLNVSGNYYNVAVDGATAVGSLAFPNTGAIPDSLNGKSVTATGYLMGVSGSSTKYVNMMLVSIYKTGTEPSGGNDDVTGTSLLENGGFEVWNDTVPAAWYTNNASNASIVRSSDALDGSYAVQLNASSSNKRLATRAYNLKAGSYIFAIDAKSLVGTEAGSLRMGYVPVKEDGSAISTSYTYLLEKTAVTSAWKQYRVNFTFASDTTVSMVIMVSAGSGTALLADRALLIKTDSTIVVPPVPGEPGTISTALAASAGDSCYVKGTVAATYARGFVITDKTGAILVYTGAASTLTPGTLVTVRDTIATRYGLNQFPTSAVVTSLGIDVSFSQPAPRTLDGAAMDAYVTTPSVTYITYTGVLALSGSYYNVTVDGTAVVGSISYPVDNYASLVGDTVQVTGWAVGVSGSSTRFLNTMVTEVKNVGGSTPVDPDDKTTGDGSKENPYTVADVVLLANSQSGPAWVTGKVGGTYANGGVLTTADWTLSSNIGLTDSKGNVIPVQLPTGSVRDALNLVDNPALFGETVKVYGTLTSYFSAPGVKSVTDYVAPTLAVKPVVPAAPDFSVSGGQLTVKGYAEVFNVVGQRVASVTAGSVTLSRGIYMVKCNGKVSKVFVK